MTKFFRHKMLIISILFTFCNIALPFWSIISASSLLGAASPVLRPPLVNYISEFAFRSCFASFTSTVILRPFWVIAGSRMPEFLTCIAFE